MKAVNLRTEHMIAPMGMDVQKPMLSWCCEGGVFQTAFQIVAMREDVQVWDSGVQKANRMHCRVAVPLNSRDRIRWKVRLWDENDQPGPWSEEAIFELGITDKAEWQAKWIDPETESYDGPADDAINQKAREAWEQGKQKQPFQPHLPCSYLKKKFVTSPGKKNRLYITSKGIYQAWLNGKPVGKQVLAPGPAVYDHYIPVQTYDLDELLTEGENELLIALGDGWYRSCSGVNGDRNLYGANLALICQVMVDDMIVCITNESWQASQHGPIRQNDLQQGEVYDARMDEITRWHGVNVTSTDYSLLQCDNSVPIVTREILTGKLLTTPNGEQVLDFGQNLAGFLALDINTKAGQRIFLQCGETLDENGNFTQENFQDRHRHSENGTHQMIEYICKDGKNHYRSTFTIMGFRYAKLETDADLTDARFYAVAIYSQMAQTGTFTCGNELVNQLVENCIWSQKGNFCGVPTDCPTRERAGWTGDAGVFVDTGLDLMDCYPVFAKWLGDCRCLQHDDGRVSMIAPVINRPGLMTNLLSGSAGWGDASIMVPWAMYRRTGDLRILQESYPLMQRWYAYLEGRAAKGKLKKLLKKNPWKKYLICSGIDYGEWCEAGIDNFRQMSKGNYDVATAYLAHSGELLAEIATILNFPEDAKHYREVSEGAKKAFCSEFTDNGKIESSRQCQYVRPLAFELLPEHARQQAAEDLAQLVRENGYHLNTGFLSTPHLCKVLADFGYIEEAENVLLQEDCPGWLYAVKKGATTIWENWDGIDENGKPKASLNHYSYGAIAGWLIRSVCGICQDQQSITLKPTVLPKLGHARAVYDSPVGRIESGWNCNSDGTVTYDFTIPANTKAEFVTADQRISLKPGRHTVSIRALPTK